MQSKKDGVSGLLRLKARNDDLTLIPVMTA